MVTKTVLRAGNPSLKNKVGFAILTDLA